jgi:hypothetical protein
MIGNRHTKVAKQPNGIKKKIVGSKKCVSQKKLGGKRYRSLKKGENHFFTRTIFTYFEKK